VTSFGIIALVDPNKPGRYPTCPFLAVTGHWCPGCGSLRAIHALSQGEVGAAFGLNVLTVAALPLLAIVWFRWTRRRWNGTSPRRLVHPAYLWSVLVIEIVFWVVRNLPMGAALAP
jgi:hypothetical protein